jgi:predicted negative regulator of RcsB-dependent stress response
VPDGATFASIRCRLEALRARVAAENGLGTFQAKLDKSLATALARLGDARGLCDGGNLKKTRKRLQQARKAVDQYDHRLGSLAARKKLDTALRSGLQAAGKPIESDLRTLRSTVACAAS